MRREDISRAVGDIADRHIMEAAGRRTVKRSVLWRCAAAVAAICLAIGAWALLSTGRGGTVTAYAYGTEQQITSAGSAFTTGAITEDGELSGRPLMFCLAGEKIEKVRFSSKNEFIEFRDLTEKREEYGVARNFTVPYGENGNEYGFLVIDWAPNNLRTALRTGRAELSGLPDELRLDTIVMEVSFIGGGAAVKAITVEVRADGSVFAIFDDYAVKKDDDFLKCPDAEAVPRELLYGHGDAVVSFIDLEGDEAMRDAGWYNLDALSDIVVSWTGETPLSVRVFCTPTGTETAEEEKLLATRVPLDEEGSIAFPARTIIEAYGGELMGHLAVELDYGTERVATDPFEVYAEGDAEYYWMVKHVTAAAKKYLEENGVGYSALEFQSCDGDEAKAAVWTVSETKEPPDMTVYLRKSGDEWKVVKTE